MGARPFPEGISLDFNFNFNRKGNIMSKITETFKTDLETAKKIAKYGDDQIAAKSAARIVLASAIAAALVGRAVGVRSTVKSIERGQVPSLIPFMSKPAVITLKNDGLEITAGNKGDAPRIDATQAGLYSVDQVIAALQAKGFKDGAVSIEDLREVL